MFRPFLLATVCAVSLMILTETASAQQGYGQNWGSASSQNWQKFYNYPYVYYPHNYYTPEYYQSNGDMYHRYPAEMQVPAYDKNWMNFYPSSRRYYSGSHFRLDIF
ncbi:hypothetical protein FACS189454_03620 [Planctomycetales bacterium]|nr:hypothetical protein FACS189454_03620 [Planctomycetales bacterium]